MATTTAPTTLVALPCGRCDGHGHYGGQVAGGKCFSCDVGTIYVTAAQYIADRRRAETTRERTAARAEKRITELARREQVALDAIEGLAATIQAEGDITAEDYRSFPAGFALNNGCVEDLKWDQSDDEGVAWVRRLWGSYLARA